MTTTEGTQEEPVKYCTNLRASVETEINENPRAFVHSREWKKIMNGRSSSRKKMLSICFEKKRKRVQSRLTIVSQICSYSR